MESVMEHQHRIKMRKEQKQKAIADERQKEERRYQLLQAIKQKKLEEEARKRRKAFALAKNGRHERANSVVTDCNCKLSHLT
jgi:hypothetical protein